MKRRSRLAAVLVTVLGLALSLLVASPSQASNMKFSGWLPYWLMKESTNAAVNNSTLFTDVSPFWFDLKASSATASGATISDNWISWGTRPAITQSLRAKGIKVLPSITDGSPAQHVRGILRNTTKRNALIAQIRAKVAAGGFDGIDLDFEKFAFSDGQSTWATTKPAWISFIAGLRAALRADGKLLAVTVPPQYSDTSGYWVYALREIAPHTDRLRIMAYDYSYSTAGPVGGPLSWLRTILNYTTQVFPRSKIYLGTPTYGRDWVVSKTGTGCPATSTKVLNTNAVAFNSQWTRDAASRERTRTYSERVGNCTITRRAFVPDTATTVARWNVAKEYNIAGLAQWMIGTEQSNQWSSIRSLTPALPTPPAAPVVKSRVTIRVAKVWPRRVTVAGQAIGTICQAVRINAAKAQPLKNVRTVSCQANRYRVAIPFTGNVIKVRAVSGGVRSPILTVTR